MARRKSPKRLNALTAELVGDWDGAIRFCGSMGYEVKKKTQEAQWAICKKLKQKVIQHMLRQDLPWTELSKYTIKNKDQNKNYKLIHTETYLNNIKIWKIGGQAFVGVKKGILYKRKSGSISLERVAIHNEFGNRRVPARPLWNPSIAELGGPEGMKQFIADAIYRRLKWLARGTPMKITQKKILKRVK